MAIDNAEIDKILISDKYCKNQKKKEKKKKKSFCVLHSLKKKDDENIN